MKRAIIKIMGLGMGLMLVACASTEPKPLAIMQSKTLMADGYGSFDDRLQVKQRWLSTQQIAKLNAYRGLADQLYDEPLANGDTIGSKVIGDEAYRIYLDNYLREARASDYRTLNSTLKVTLSLTLTPQFYQCMGGDQAAIKHCLRHDHKLDFQSSGP